jgi:hypothetical protein
LLTQRRQQKAESAEYYKRVAQINASAKYTTPIGITAQSIINDVKEGTMPFYRKANGVYTVDNGCPCTEIKNPIV